ncbi:folate-Biopterin Transporter (FBT) family [Thraustotheca clavata]|uniref:Folate-Biopterin Transporter (FBT) family n=1 Tax=Thraustotheca clavata TaxID=74557 RepID=A0A1V9YIL0_9STRA|nr:folate-Biopterin Transporter (FBT) family [Thraustotheca clavata]
MLAQREEKLDLEERVSYIHSADKDGMKPEGYEDAKTPGELEDGALVEGGALHLFSREAFGLFSQYGAIGIIYGMIPYLSYSLYTVYLGMEGYQTASYGVLVTTGWSFKVVWGMLSDCIPIFGYRRKSWMLIGWTITMICLSIMTFSPFGNPYCDRRIIGDLCKKPRANVLQNLTTMGLKEDDIYDMEAPNRGMLFIMMSMLVSFGYVVAACASDAMVVQYAQREPIAIRGRIQTAIYVVRTMTGIISQLFIAFFLNGKVYGGSFNFSVGPNVAFGVCLVPCVFVVLTTIFVVVEKKTPRTPFFEWTAMFWNLLQKRVMWQICAFRFINNCFQSMNATPNQGPLADVWAGVEPLNDSLSGVIGNLIFSGILVVVGKWGLNWNWRWTIAISSIGVVLIDGFVVFMTIWGVVRDQWFYTGVALADNVPGGVRFIIATYCAVEIADPGTEGATYGLVTTISNLASPVASVFYKYIDSYFKVTVEDLRKDDTEVRWEVTYCFLISYACKLFALVWLFMLPPQKAEMQELKRRGGKSKLAGAILILLFIGALSFSLTSSIMSVNPSTKCYRIAGGKGTVNGTCLKPK